MFKRLNDTVNILLQFENGSTGVVAYYSNGSKGLPKEYIEINRSGVTAVLSDFKRISIFGKGKIKKKRLLNQNKGQKEMMAKFLNQLKSDGQAPISFDQIYTVSEASFAVLESISQGGKNISIKYE